MNSNIAGTHGQAYEHLFRHPTPHNLEWREVLSMFRGMPNTTVEGERNGHYQVTRNDHVLVLHRPHGKDIADTDEVIRIRHFIERSSGPAATPPTAGTHLLVVIDHQQARIYSAELHGTKPQHIRPYDPYGFGRALHFVHTGGDGELRPERKSFYEAVAKTLRGAQQILVFGTATGASSAMEHLLLDLKKHHHDVAERIIGSVAVDEHHLTDDQLLAKARELFTAASP